jgi:hypothetical protein
VTAVAGRELGEPLLLAERHGDADHLPAMRPTPGKRDRRCPQCGYDFWMAAAAGEPKINGEPGMMGGSGMAHGTRGRASQGVVR